MIIQPTKPNPTFGWGISQKCTRYGNNMVKCTEYHRDNGYKLLVMDTWRDGKKQTTTKELYNNAWRLVKQKVIQFTNGKKDITTEFIAQNYDIQNR